MTKTNASAVSRLLRQNGMLPVPRHTRDGLSVGNAHGSVSLIASAVEPSLRKSIETETALIDQAVEILTTHGYTVNRTQHSIAYATKGN